MSLPRQEHIIRLPFCQLYDQMILCSHAIKPNKKNWLINKQILLFSRNFILKINTYCAWLVLDFCNFLHFLPTLKKTQHLGSTHVIQSTWEIYKSSWLLFNHFQDLIIVHITCIIVSKLLTSNLICDAMGELYFFCLGSPYLYKVYNGRFESKLCHIKEVYAIFGVLISTFILGEYLL